MADRDAKGRDVDEQLAVRGKAIETLVGALSKTWHISHLRHTCPQHDCEAEVCVAARRALAVAKEAL